MDFDKLLKLIDVIEKSSLTKFTYKEDNTEINIEKKNETINDMKDMKKDIVLKENTNEHIKDTDNNQSPKKENYHYIKSPLVGTFYTSPSPKERKFVCVGDKVTKGQIIGIIEAMKIMNEVKSNVNGVIEEILIDDEEVVEYGQGLVKIRLS